MTTEICQSCGGTVVRIVYGMPDENLMAAASEGLVALGGCIIWPGNPTWKCLDCGNSGSDDPALEHEKAHSTPRKRAVLTRPQPGETKERLQERLKAALLGTPKPEQGSGPT